MITKAITNELRRHAFHIKHNADTIDVRTDYYEVQLDKKATLAVDPYFLDADSKFVKHTLVIEQVHVKDDISKISTKGKPVLFLAPKLSHVAQCAATDEARPVITSVKFENDKIVATDSYKLRTAITSHKFSGEYNAKAIQLAIKATATKKDNLIAVTQDSRNSLVFFAIDNTFKMVIPDQTKADSYPKWEELMPSEPGEAMMMPALKQESNPYGSRGTLCVVFKEGKGYLFSDQSVMAKCIKPIEGMFPKTFDRYMLNYQYLREATQGMKNVMISFSGHTRPVMFVDAINDGCSIVMPIRADHIETMIDLIVPF